MIDNDEDIIPCSLNRGQLQEIQEQFYLWKKTINYEVVGDIPWCAFANGYKMAMENYEE